VELAGNGITLQPLWAFFLNNLSFLAQRETTPNYSKFRLMGGLVTWERENNLHRLKLLYLPPGISW